MGTRSLTFVYDGDEPIVNMYRQFDGYPEGHGQELAEFLCSGKLVEGYSARRSVAKVLFRSEVNDYHGEKVLAK